MKNKYEDFYNYTADQFAENEYFQQWVCHSSKDTDIFWSNYIKLFPQQYSVIEAAKNKVEFTLNCSGAGSLSKNEKLLLKHLIFSEIRQPVNLFKIAPSTKMQLFKFAAIIAGIIFLPNYLLNKLPKAFSLMVESTGVAQTKQFILPDSTVVILNANSSITFDKGISNNYNREIFLEGNAFFKVKKKENHNPFTVHAKAVSITVLGTEFNVNARTKATEIVLKTGKVKVSLGDKNAMTVFMDPGEKIRLDTVHSTLIKSAENINLYDAWTEGKWKFYSTSLLDITKMIYEYYGIETVFNNKKAKQLKISAVIPVSDLSSFINIIANTLDIKISEKHNKLHVQY